MATLKDVARLACVDVSTVSRALNNTSYVHPDTKARIYAAAKELGYHPNVMAQALRQGRRHVIGVVVPRLHLAIFSEILQGIEREAGQLGYSTLICFTEDDPKAEKDCLNRLRGGFDALERYVVGNMLGDLLPDGALLMTAGVDKDVLALAGAAADHDADGAVARLKKEFKRFEQAPMLSAASRVGTLDELPLLFRQVQELLGLNMDTDAGGLLRPGHTAFLPETVGEIFNFDAMRQAGDYEALVAELALDFLKMEAKNFDGRQRQQLCALAWKLLFADKPAPSPTLAGWAGALTAAWGLPHPDERSREIYLAIYENVGDPDFSLQRIAQERLYVSEDHLRRVFSQLTGKRFSVYLEQCRIRLACWLLEYQPDMKISRLAELVGYPLDGQYFSKVFRKLCGVTPTEYRNKRK